MHKKGFLLTIEGIDGAGKTTLAKSLHDKLQSMQIPVILSKEPTDGPYGKKIRESAKTKRLPLERELFLFIQDRKEHVEKIIKPALKNGKVVILDRYMYSTIAYQGARGASVAEIYQEHCDFAIEPDLLVILDLPIDEALARIKKTRGSTDEFEVKSYLKQVASNYLKVKAPVILYLEATKSTEDLAEDVLENFFNSEY